MDVAYQANRTAEPFSSQLTRRCIGKRAPRLYLPESHVRRLLAKSGRPSAVVTALADNTGNGGAGGGGGKHLGGGGDDDSQGPRSPERWSLPLFFVALSISKPAQAAFRKKRKKQVETSPELDRLLDLSWPVLKNLGFSGLLGALSAVALKTVGTSLAVIVGLLFGFTQVGAYLGYIKVDWAKVHKDVLRRFDINSDGKFDSRDLSAVTAGILAVLSQGVPSLGGFCAGFFWGLSLRI